MPNSVKTVMYILTVVGISFAICTFIVGIKVDDEWLYGALLVPLVAVLGQTRGQDKQNE